MKIEKLTNEKWLNLYKAIWVDKKGKNREWIFASRKDPSGEIIPNNKRTANAVVIVPIIRDSDSDFNKLVITKEWRAPINDYEYGFPAGLVEGNETALGVAIRELKEETGLDVDCATDVSPPVFSSVGMTDETVRYIHVYCKGEISNKHLEEDEDIETKAYSIDELSEMYQENINWGAKAWPYIYNFVRQGKIAF